MRVLLGSNHIVCQALILQRPQGLSVRHYQIKGPGIEYQLRDGQGFADDFARAETAARAWT